MFSDKFKVYLKMKKLAGVRTQDHVIQGHHSKSANPPYLDTSFTPMGSCVRTQGTKLS